MLYVENNQPLGRLDTMNPPTLTVAAEARNASKIYGSGDSEVRALDDVSVSFNSGEFTAIMGPSGSGKSTLMHCIAGLDELTKGSAIIDDVDLSGLNDRELTTLRREKIGFIFQSFNLVPTLTADENIRLPLLLGGQDGDAEWIAKVIETVHLNDRLTHRPSELWAASNSASPWPVRLRHNRGSSSPTSRRATSTPPPERRSCAS